MFDLSFLHQNDFQTRDNVLRFAVGLLDGLRPYTKNGRTRLPSGTGTGFDEVAAQLEGYARPLWVVADLLALDVDKIDLRPWIDGLRHGTDPESDTYWGDVCDFDQRMVEMEPIAYALLAAPESFDRGHNTVAWLRSINDRGMPESNWLWFRVLVNLALVKSCGVPLDEVKDIIDHDLEILDSFCLGDGWSTDGLWTDDKKQADYYSGSFAIQYSRMVYVRFAHFDGHRVARYREEASQFANTFWRYFAADGKPFNL